MDTELLRTLPNLPNISPLLTSILNKMILRNNILKIAQSTLKIMMHNMITSQSRKLRNIVAKIIMMASKIIKPKDPAVKNKSQTLSRPQMNNQ